MDWHRQENSNLMEPKLKTVAYLFVSSDRTEIENQKQIILRFAGDRKIQISRYVEIPISSSNPTKGRKLNRLLCHVGSGDTLVVSRLSQMGFSLAEIVKTVDTLINREIRLVAIEEPIDLKWRAFLQITGHRRDI